MSIDGSHIFLYLYQLDLSLKHFQNSRTPGTLVHGNQPESNGLIIGRVTAGIEYSRPFRPKWNGTAGLVFQVHREFVQ